MTKNQNVLKWVEEMKALTQPDKVVWIDGSEEQLKALRDEAIRTGEMIELNQEKLPGCLYHRTAENDVARVEDRTFICSREKENAGPTNNWMDPKEMYAKLTKLYDGVMKGRTMYVIPYSMGPIGSPIAKVGVELTDSIYVVLNMDIMTRMGAQAFKNLPDDSNRTRSRFHSGHPIIHLKSKQKIRHVIIGKTFSRQVNTISLIFINIPTPEQTDQMLSESQVIIYRCIQTPSKRLSRILTIRSFFSQILFSRKISMIHRFKHL